MAEINVDISGTLYVTSTKRRNRSPFFWIFPNTQMRSQTTAAPDAARDRGRRKDPPGNPAARPRGRQTDVEPPPQPPAAAGSAETRHAESERIPPNHSARKRHVRSRGARPRGRDGSGGIFCASKGSSPAAGAGRGGDCGGGSNRFRREREPSPEAASLGLPQTTNKNEQRVVRPAGVCRTDRQIREFDYSATVQAPSAMVTLVKTFWASPISSKVVWPLMPG